MAPLSVVLFLILATGTTGQRYGWGSCPYQAAQPNFNFLAYYGRWYEQLKYDNELQFGFKCDTRDYSFGGGGYINVIHKRFDIIGRSEFDVLGTMATYQGPSEGKFEARYKAFPLYDVPMRYWVVETDYTSYSINWSCRDIPNFMNRQYLWVYTRERNPSEEFLSQLRYKLGYKGFDTGPLQRTVQDCGNYPKAFE